jgi:hypothetical protein
MVYDSQHEPAQTPEIATLTHSHLSIRHLLVQIESGRTARSNRDIRPAWLTEFIEFAADLFEPLADVGRVRFSCGLDESGWNVDLHLGAIELVGGKNDGQSRHLPFRFNLKPLLEQFAAVSEVTWTAMPESDAASELVSQSVVVVRGTIGAEVVQLAIYSIAPPAAAPGLRQLPDGRFEPA